MTPDFSTLKVGDKVIRRWGLFEDWTDTAVATVTLIAGFRVYVEYQSPGLMRYGVMRVPEAFSRKTGLPLGGGGIIGVQYETGTPEAIAEIEVRTMAGQ